MSERVTLNNAIDELAERHVPAAMVTYGQRTPAQLRADVQDFLIQLTEYPEGDDARDAAHVVLGDPNGLDRLIGELTAGDEN